jgi:hypothetical protein
MPTTYISNSAHNTNVLSRVAAVRKSLWIGTDDGKSMQTNTFMKNYGYPFTHYVNRNKCIFAVVKNAYLRKKNE